MLMAVKDVLRPRDLGYQHNKAVVTNVILRLLVHLNKMSFLEYDMGYIVFNRILTEGRRKAN